MTLGHILVQLRPNVFKWSLNHCEDWKLTAGNFMILTK